MAKTISPSAQKAHGKKTLCRELLTAKLHFAVDRSGSWQNSSLPLASLFAVSLKSGRRENIFCREPDFWLTAKCLALRGNDKISGSASTTLGKTLDENPICPTQPSSG
jgi:hypothetical protein